LHRRNAALYLATRLSKARHVSTGTLEKPPYRATSASKSGGAGKLAAGDSCGIDVEGIFSGGRANTGLAGIELPFVAGQRRLQRPKRCGFQKFMRLPFCRKLNFSSWPLGSASWRIFRWF
jgi:hypothetical protein